MYSSDHTGTSMASLLDHVSYGVYFSSRACYLPWRALGGQQFALSTHQQCTLYASLPWGGLASSVSECTFQYLVLVERLSL